MSKITHLWIVAVMAAGLMVGGCDNDVTPSQPGENLLEPRQWMQIQSDEQGSGFNGVHTAHAIGGNTRWLANVGELVASSPVIDPQGDVWVANTRGQLVEIGPNGVIKTRVGVGGRVISSPAVDEHGRVYVLGQYRDPDDEESFRTILHCWDPASGFVALDGPPKYRSTASPKIWRDYVFVPSGRTLRIFDRWTLKQITEHVACPSIVCGGSDILEDVIDTISNGLGFVGSCVVYIATLGVVEIRECAATFENSLAYKPGPDVDPSVAIVDNATIVDNVNVPIIVMATPQCLTAFNFDPTAPVRLRARWYHEIVEIDCDFEFLNVTTPAVLTTDQVVIGDNRGRVRSFHIDDGAELWTYEAKAGGQVQAIRCPPVAGLRQIYVLTDRHLIVLDSDGEELSRTVLKGQGGGLSLSLDHVYAMTTEGIYTGSLDGNGRLIDRSFDDAAIVGVEVGSTVPAIDRDGNVYLASPAGFVFKYGPGLITFSAPFPNVSWVEPGDGTTIYSSSQMMRVALNSDDAFTGHVTISSDVDGVLCEFDVENSVDGACVPAEAMTVGPHVLTAFATNSEGVQESAEINVDVIPLVIE